MQWKDLKHFFHLNRKRKPAPDEHFAFIDLRGINKVYEGPSGGFHALKEITLQIQSGEMVAIAGKSGSGKSTLLNMITGIDRPTSGEIYINEVPLHKLDEGRLTIWRGNAVGIIFQFFQLLPTMTLLENVILPMDFCHYGSRRSRRERAMRLLSEVDLGALRNRLPAHVSGGQQQRAAIARALANDPPIIVADEPTGNLDTASAEAVFQLLQRLVALGKTVIVVTHDPDLAQRCQRIISIADGRITTDQPTQEPEAAPAVVPEVVPQVADEETAVLEPGT